MKAKINDYKEKDVRAYPTRSKSSQTDSKSKNEERFATGNVGILTELDVCMCVPSAKVTLQDDLSSLDATGRCDDESEGTFAFLTTAEAAVISVVGRFTNIKSVKILVTLRKGAAVESFQLSRVWKVSLTIVHLMSGQFAIVLGGL